MLILGFVNDGIITTAGSNNIGWISDEGGNTARQLYFHTIEQEV